MWVWEAQQLCPIVAGVSAFMLIAFLHFVCIFMLIGRSQPTSLMCCMFIYWLIAVVPNVKILLARIGNAAAFSKVAAHHIFSFRHHAVPLGFERATIQRLFCKQLRLHFKSFLLFGSHIVANYEQVLQYGHV